jgi:hypothetical protein
MISSPSSIGRMLALSAKSSMDDGDDDEDDVVTTGR